MIINQKLLRDVSTSDREKLRAVLNLIWQLNAFSPTLKKKRGPTYRCHTLCRAIAAHIPGLRVIDGEFVGTVLTSQGHETRVQHHAAKHSWLATETGTIIDPYPVGVLTANPILVITRGRYAPFGGGHYHPRDRAYTRRIMNGRMYREAKTFIRFIARAKKYASQTKTPGA